MMNDRGDRLIMTNLRHFTVSAVLDHMKDLADKADQFAEAAQRIYAADAIFGAFPQSQRVHDAGSSSGKPRQVLKPRDGELCEPHKKPRRWKDGFKKVSGEYYELLECTNVEGGQCKPIWAD